jgi:hypothetical protein
MITWEDKSQTGPLPLVKIHKTQGALRPLASGVAC